MTISIPMPTEEHMRLVGGNKPDVVPYFVKIGEWMKSLVKREGLVFEGARILDIGCGCGRLARYLVDEPITKYVGFDRHHGMIEWCQQNITPADPRFQFDFAAVKSPAYDHRDGVTGTIAADEYVFPYKDGEFTGTFLASVFTHMPISEVAQYLKEIGRVVDPGGKVLYSAFVAAGEEFSDDGNNWLIPMSRLKAVTEDAGMDFRVVSNPGPGKRLQAWFLGTKH